MGGMTQELVVRQPGECRNCGGTTTEVRRFTCSNKTFQVRRQCVACGGAVGTPIPHWQVTDLMRLPAWDNEPAAQAEAARESAADAQRAEREAQNEAWQARYNQHLHSPEWRRIADKVLTRAGYLCEGCAEQRATQVHHLTYDHLGSELLYELRALCRSCHEHAHEKKP